ncbi:hypothetical protein L209DRAFT_758739 [Thermothelomyces heterothallicus CBS 203.75]
MEDKNSSSATDISASTFHDAKPIRNGKSQESLCLIVLWQDCPKHPLYLALRGTTGDMSNRSSQAQGRRSHATGSHSHGQLFVPFPSSIWRLANGYRGQLSCSCAHCSGRPVDDLRQQQRLRSWELLWLCSENAPRSQVLDEMFTLHLERLLRDDENNR